MPKSVRTTLRVGMESLRTVFSVRRPVYRTQCDFANSLPGLATARGTGRGDGALQRDAGEQMRAGFAAVRRAGGGNRSLGGNAAAQRSEQSGDCRGFQ